MSREIGLKPLKQTTETGDASLWCSSSPLFFQVPCVLPGVA